VIHQTGEADYERTLAEYERSGIAGEVYPFIQDMSAAYRRADIVVSRAGASTLSELAALGKPSILVPYPHAANRHQEVNALTLVHRGGAEMIHQSDLTGEALSKALTKYMDDRILLKETGERASGLNRPGAAEEIVRNLLEVVHSREGIR
jgi:UDP-N-acetylglucosamine--N-acetylmuramyl-(pentapeptide) pyrophosphoryl-undecaprenol N-acetylglucosamine transferase